MTHAVQRCRVESGLKCEKKYGHLELPVSVRLINTLNTNCRSVTELVQALLRGLIQGFVLDGKSYRPELATAQTSNEFAVSGVRMTTSI